MKLGFLFFAVAFCFSSSGLSVEVKLGQNHFACENYDFGKFEIEFSITGKVNEWGLIESKLTSLNFTSGELFTHPGITESIKDAELEVQKNLLPGPHQGQIDLLIKFPKENFPTNLLTLNHSHPKEYESSELGAQSFIHIGNKFYQTFFVCTGEEN